MGKYLGSTKSKGGKAKCTGKLEVGFAELGSSHEEAMSSVARPENSKAVGYKHKKRP